MGYGPCYGSTKVAWDFEYIDSAHHDQRNRIGYVLCHMFVTFLCHVSLGVSDIVVFLLLGFGLFVSGPQALPWCAKDAQGLGKANRQGFNPRHHLGPTAGKGAPVPHPPRTTAHTGVCRWYDRESLGDSPLETTRNRGGLTVGRALCSVMALLWARVERADYATTL